MTKTSLQVLAPRICVLLLVLATIFPHPTVRAAEVPLQRIAFQRAFPSWMRNALPTGVQSLFRGQFSLPKSRDKWALQLFNPNPQAECGTENTICTLQLQLFRNQKLARSLPFRFEDPSVPQLFGAQLLWLDKNQTQPILRVDAFERLENGILGDYLFFTFPDAKRQFLGTNSIQRLRFGRWIFGDSSGQDTEFRYNANGILELHAQVLSTGELPATPWYATWDGRQWQSHKPPDTYVNSFLLMSEPLQK